MVICITNRKLCNEDFYDRIEKIAKCRPFAIVLREKDLPEKEYEEMAVNVKKICDNHNVLFIINSFYNAAEKIGVKAVHLPFPLLKEWKRTDFFERAGTSVHSVEEAIEAEKIGADYLICGHIFPTDCKKDLAPRGLEFAENIKKAVKIPVFAIGGIDENNVHMVLNKGLDGVCIMSTLMNCDSERIKRICEI